MLQHLVDRKENHALSRADVVPHQALHAIEGRCEVKFWNRSVKTWANHDLSLARKGSLTVGHFS
jgi:hypothetical protein